MWVINQFKSYAVGFFFVVVTNYSALRSLRTKEQLDWSLHTFSKVVHVYLQYSIMGLLENLLADQLTLSLFYFSTSNAATMA